MNKVSILVGDAKEVLKTLPDQSIHCVVTSPPYWGLRSYHLKRWEGGDPDCEHEAKPLGRGEHRTVEGAWDRPSRMAVPRQPVCMRCGALEHEVSGGVGVEPTFEEYVDNLMAVFDEVWRVLRDDGTLWLNLGDTYVGGGRGEGSKKMGKMQASSRGTHDLKKCPEVKGLKPKDLMFLPTRIAMALQERGWYCRSEIVWVKPNPMPESVKDRPTCAHEKMFLLSKSRKYYYDYKAVRTPIRNPKDLRQGEDGFARPKTVHPDHPRKKELENYTLDGVGRRKEPGEKPDGGHRKNRPNIPGARTHGKNRDRNDNDFAERMRRKYEEEDKVKWPGIGKQHAEARNRGESQQEMTVNQGANLRNTWKISTHSYKGAHFATFPPALVEPCVKAGCPEGGTVLDPFGGSGTTALVASRLLRNAVIIEISAEYAEIARQRVGAEISELLGQEIEVVSHASSGSETEPLPVS